MLLSLSQTITDKGTLIAETEIEVGVEVFIEDENGEMVAAPDGDYTTDDKVITVVDGKVTEIKDKEKETKEKVAKEKAEQSKRKKKDKNW